MISDYSEDADGGLITRQTIPGLTMDARWNSFLRFEFHFADVRSGEEIFAREQVRSEIGFTPSRRISRVELLTTFGDEVDFANHRLGDGVNLSLFANIRPTDHLDLTVNASRRTLDVTAEDGREGRLFTAEVGRLRATYTFDARSWLRLIGQYVETERDPSLHTFEVDEQSGGFNGSAVFAYKLNWQTVLYLGYADNRVLADPDQLEPADRQLFLKVSYAYQR